jgi:Domain of unknown function (DUF4304)
MRFQRTRRRAAFIGSCLGEPLKRSVSRLMAKSLYAQAVDKIQSAIRPLLRERGFRVRGRTFNRQTDDALIQVVNIQMGPSDPPGTSHIPGLRDNLHGLFAINLGVYVPEVARHHGGSEAKSWVQEYHCCVRARLGELVGGGKEIWWHARADEEVIADVRRCLEDDGLPFLERFATRDRILAQWDGQSENMGASSPPRIVSAIILAERGEREHAHVLLSQQVLETRNPGHPKYVRSLAEALGLGRLDG